MNWIKLSDKAPKFDTLIELEVPVPPGPPMSLQARLIKLSGAGAEFEIFFPDETKKRTIPSEEVTYWQEKPRPSKASKGDPENGSTRKKRVMPDEEKQRRSDIWQRKKAEKKALEEGKTPAPPEETKPKPKIDRYE